MGTKRTDRLAGKRGAYEKAREVILKTQTVCGICGKPVDFHYKYPHPLSPTVDHIIPVAKGGDPSDLDNLQLAHRCCNRQKSDKLTETILSEAERRQTNELVSNRVLPQHFDWSTYKG